MDGKVEKQIWRSDIARNGGVRMSENLLLHKNIENIDKNHQN